MTIQSIHLRAIFCVVLLGSALYPPRRLWAEDKTCSIPTSVKDEKFVPGQVWSYKTRHGEELSTLTILRVESTPKLGTIVHVRIDGIRFKSCNGGSGPEHLGHAPFNKDALEMSVTKLLRTESQIPNYAEGYQEWLSHCGGIYTISVAEVIALDDATFRAGSGCKA